jgi:2-keto-3-deoxy-L-rhamnonate aldolase RhmA
MNNKTFKKKLLSEKVSLGCWLTLAHPGIAEIMSNAGFDWIAIDLEHSVITIKEAEELIRIIELSGVTPLVRLTSNNEDQIKRVMDAGACGIIVPMIKTVDDVNHAISSIKYPPKGNRGVGLARAQGYGSQFEQYFKWQDENSVVIIQIEHIDAVNNLESLFSVNDVDGYIIGPYDLSASMGIPGQFENKLFLSAMDRIKNVASSFNMIGGIHIIEPDNEQLNLRVEEGYKFIAYSLDVRMLDVLCRSGVNFLNNLTK